MKPQRREARRGRDFFAASEHIEGGSGERTAGAANQNLCVLKGLRVETALTIGRDRWATHPEAGCPDAISPGLRPGGVRLLSRPGAGGAGMNALAR